MINLTKIYSEKSKDWLKDEKECQYSLDNTEFHTKISIDDDEKNEEKKKRPVLANILLISNHFHK